MLPSHQSQRYPRFSVRPSPHLFTFLVCILHFHFAAYSQSQLGFQGGVSFSFGTHLSRIGFNVRTYALSDRLQANLGLAGFYNFRQLGTDKHCLEIQAQVGMLVGVGSYREEEKVFVHEMGNQTNYRNAVAFAYNLYFDQSGTNQQSGTFGLHIGDVLCAFENDFLGFSGDDKFRTGSFGVYLNRPTTRLGIELLIWTGDPYSNQVVNKDDPDFPARYGYLDISQAPYGNHSLGAVNLRIDQHLPLNQFASASLGIDAEQVRNWFQNKLIHDNPLLPINWWGAQNPHIPMLDQDGQPYLYREGQRIRTPRLYAQFSANPSLFY
ncbi:MAG: polymorphic toxin type 23 domain-containing protein [Bacteroidota bacterium]